MHFFQVKWKGVFHTVRNFHYPVDPLLSYEGKKKKIPFYKSSRNNVYGEQSVQVL